MYSSLIIVLREGFEMALVVCLIMAAANKIKGSNRIILSGVIAGVVASIALGVLAFNNPIIHSSLRSPVTSTLILAVAATLIAWTVIWMQSQGRELAQRITATAEGSNTLKPLAIVAFLTIVREGVETVLLLLGVASNSEASVPSIFIGSLIGGALALLIGVLMFYGLLKVNIRKSFAVFSFLMTFMAAGMYGNAISKLVKHDYVNPIIKHVWNTTAFFDHHTNPMAMAAKVVLGFAEKPSLTQVMVYLIALSVIFFMRKNASEK
jgi:high-affinity iron transporter